MTMQTIIRVAETGSFSAVAREQNTMQSAVRKQVAVHSAVHFGGKFFSN